MKKLLWLALVAAVAAGGWLAWSRRGAPVPITWRTTPLTRGTVVEAVSTTGSLKAVTTVQVGTQVTGVIDQILVDFNDHVDKGQVIARLETDVLEARLAQDEAALAAARASVEGARVAVEQAQTNQRRVQSLYQQKLAKQEDLDAAGFAVRSAEANLQAEQTHVTQAEATVRMSRTNLDHATITSPIHGVVLDRAVDVGQTVAASLQAPTLFTLAEDLREMRVEAAVDEADIGRIHTGQHVTFTVDAYPDRQFEGRVAQRRLGPTVTQNVVTYQVIVETKNDDETLLPGMTANVSVEVARADDALLVPASALRFQPPAAAEGAAATTARGAARPGEGGQGGGRGDGQGQGGGRGDGQGQGGGAAHHEQHDRTGHGRVWVLEGSGEAAKPRPVRVKLGPSDGSLVAIEPVDEGALAEGAPILMGYEGGSSGPNGPVNPMRLLRGR
jgi:HlyD family secretion protein